MFCEQGMQNGLSFSNRIKLIRHLQKISFVDFGGIAILWHRLPCYYSTVTSYVIEAPAALKVAATEQYFSIES